MEVKASLKYARVGAQKARLVADVVRGKNIDDALKTLTVMNKKTAVMVKKLIESAVANAEYKKTVDVSRLYLKVISVDQGPGLKRWRPRAQGRATPAIKKTSHINIVLDVR